MKLCSTMSTNNCSAHDWYCRYIDQFDHPPKSAQHLIAFVKFNKGKLSWKEANLYLQNVAHHSSSQSTPIKLSMSKTKHTGANLNQHYTSLSANNKSKYKSNNLKPDTTQTSAAAQQAYSEYMKEKGVAPTKPIHLLNFAKQKRMRTVTFEDVCATIQNSYALISINSTKDKSDKNTVTVDMTQEKQELAEYIIECKEDLTGLKSKRTQTEEKYEECMEKLEMKFEQLFALFNQTKSQIKAHRKLKYEMVQKQIEEKKETIAQTLQLLETTLSDCDLKQDKNEVERVFESIPMMEDPDEYVFDQLNINPLKRVIAHLVDAIDENIY